MSPGQTGHITGQMGRVPGTDGTHTRGCPAKILYVYWFFSFPICVLNLLSHSDLLSRRTFCEHHFPGNCRHLASQRRVCGVVNLQGVVKTLRRSTSLSRSVFSTAAARLSQRCPPIARYGVFGVSTWPIGCDTPSRFSDRFPPWRACFCGGATPCHTRGISAILARYHIKTRQILKSPGVHKILVRKVAFTPSPPEKGPK